MFATPLIPRRVLFGNPDRTAARISRDGRRLAYLAAVDGVLEVWVGDLTTAADGSLAFDAASARPVTQDRGRGVRDFSWTHSPGHLIYVQDLGGDENWHVLVVDLEAGTTRDLTPIAGVQAQLSGLSAKRPHELAVGLNDRDAQWHDLHTIDIRTGERTLVLRNDRFVDVTLDDDFRPRFGLEALPTGARRLHRFLADGATEPWGDIGPDDELTTHMAGLTADGATAYLFDSRGRNTSAFVEVDTATGRATVVAEHPGADAEHLLQHPVTRRAQAVAFHGLRREWTTLDPAVAADFEALRGVCRGDATVTSRTTDDRTWVVVFQVDDGPARYYVWDRDGRRATFLFTARAALEGLAAGSLSRMHAFNLTARDGLTLPSYLSLPTWTDPQHTARPDHPLPMILLVHGGPWARDVWGFHPEHQWLANRGYAVLSVNYRGSTGFGKAFVNAADRQWSGTMHDDLVDAVRWAVAEGIADPARVAVVGGSYGGYAALAGLTFTPGLFACAVDIVGPSNLVTLIRSVPPYWLPLIQIFKRRVGDPDTAEGHAELMTRSPISHVAKIVRPLLIAQGANDPRVKKAESDQIADAMKTHGIPVTYVLFPDEGHGFARPVNNTAFRAVEETFLARHLGGRAEPIGDALEGSSIQFLAGDAG